MMLLWLVIIPLISGVLVLARRPFSRWVSLIGLAADFGLACALWVSWGSSRPKTDRWIANFNWSWIPEWGVHFHLGMDGMSLLLVMLTLFLGFLSVLASWQGIQERVAFFHFNLMWAVSGLIGVFLSLDLFLFYFFWELMLVPMYFLIAIWGHEDRNRASIKFFLFTQASGLLMFLAILGIYVIHGRESGIYTFDYFELIGTPMSSSTSLWLMLGFCAAFAVKLPVVPFHTWLPDAHTEAPTAGSVILAGLLLKTGGYGFLRFVLPLFPAAAKELAPIAMALGILGIIYGSILAFGQSDLKRLVAYSSISHMGFVLLGIFSGNELALQGSLIQMICHGLSTGALFIIAGAIQDRVHTRDIGSLGGVWSVAPRMSSSAMVFALASLGLPGLGNFVGEFLVLIGTFQVSPLASILASIGFIVSTIYSLGIVQSVFHGEKPRALALSDFQTRELTIMGALILALVWLGTYPQMVLDTAKPSLTEIRRVYR